MANSSKSRRDGRAVVELDDEHWLTETTRRISSVSRLTHSTVVFEEVGRRAGVQVPPYLLGVLGRLRDLQPARVTEVASYLDYDRSTVSRHIVELVELGWVERLVDPTDGRVVILQLTPEGQRTIEAVYRAWNELLAELTAEWTKADRLRFLTLLGRLDDRFVAEVARWR